MFKFLGTTGINGEPFRFLPLVKKRVNVARTLCSGALKEEVEDIRGCCIYVKKQKSRRS